MLTFLVLRTWYIATLLRSLGSFTTLHVATLLRPLVWVGVGWGGGDVNVPCTSYLIYCYAAEISGIVYYVTCCSLRPLVWVGVGWGGGGMLTFLVLRTWYIATLLRSLGSFTTLHVATLLRPLVWVGVGWGGEGGDVNVPCTSYLIYCYAAEISGIVYYVTCCYAAETSSVGWGGVGCGGC